MSHKSYFKFRESAGARILRELQHRTEMPKETITFEQIRKDIERFARSQNWYRTLPLRGMKFTVHFMPGLQNPGSEETDQKLHVHFAGIQQLSPEHMPPDNELVTFNCFLRGNEAVNGRFREYGAFYWPVSVDPTELKKYVAEKHPDLLRVEPLMIYNAHPILFEREYQFQIEEAVRVATRLARRAGLLSD